MTNASQVALVFNAGCSIGNELATQLVQQDVRLVLYDTPDREEACYATAAALTGTGIEIEVLPASLSSLESVERTAQSHGRIDYLFNCLVPGPAITPAELFAYPQQLLERDMAAAKAMVACKSAGAIVNQCFLGSLFQDTPLEDALLMAKGAITGLTRDICCRFGKEGIRINTLQLGLVDLPETVGVVTDRVRARKPPVGRWGTAAEAGEVHGFPGTSKRLHDWPVHLFRWWPDQR